MSKMQYEEGSESMSSLQRYHDKELRITTGDGAVFMGIGSVFPSGYGLHEFDREEEGIQLDDVILFKSDIRRVEVLTETVPEAADPRRYDDRMGQLLVEREDGTTESIYAGEVSVRGLYGYV